MFPSVSEHRVDLDGDVWVVASNTAERPLLTAYHATDLGPSHYELLASFARGEYPRDAVSDPDWLVITDGAVTSFPAERLDEGFVSQLRTAGSAMYFAAAQFVDVYRWRLGVRADMDIRLSLGREWRRVDDVEEWHPLPHLVVPRLILTPYAEPIQPPPVEGLDIDWSALCRSNPSISMAHDLLGESYELPFQGQLVLAIAAMEIATKGFIARWAPDADWFVLEMPAPPLDMILSRYFPLMTFPNKPADDQHPLPEDLRREIEYYLDMRNWLVHRADTPSRGPLPRKKSRQPPRFACEVARDLLYRLEYYNGHEWAKEAFEELAADRR